MHTLHTAECADNTSRQSATERLSATELEAIVGDPHMWISDTLAQHVIGIPRASLRRLRHEGRGPRYAKCGSSVRYKVAWLLEYIAERVVETRDSKKREAAA